MDGTIPRGRDGRSCKPETNKQIDVGSIHARHPRCIKWQDKLKLAHPSVNTDDKELKMERK